MLQSTSTNRSPSRGDARRLCAARRAAAGLVVALGLLLAAPQAPQAQFWFGSKPMPEFSDQSPAKWINSKPLSRADLKGKVVLIEIWTSV